MTKTNCWKKSKYNNTLRYESPDNYINSHKWEKESIELSKRIGGKPLKKISVDSKWDGLKRFNSEKSANKYMDKYMKVWGCK